MTWKNILRKSIETATRSAEHWAMSDLDLYERAKEYIKNLVEEGKTKNQIIVSLSLWLPNVMAHIKGFMQYLERKDAQGFSDALSEVEWFQVASAYEDDIETILSKNR